MSGKKKDPAEQPPKVSDVVRIEITPSAEQYDQLCRDMAVLRRAGAPTNTAAVVNAVHAAASAELGEG